MPLIEEVGARFVLLDKMKFLVGMREARGANIDFAKSGDAAAASSRRFSKALTEQQAASFAAAAANKRHIAAVGALAGGFDKAVKGGIVATGLIATASVKSAMTFQAAMVRLHTQAGVSTAQVKELSKAVLKLSPQVAQGPNAVADAMYRIASSQSGLHATTQKLTAMTKAAAMLASIGGPGTDLDQTARVLGGVQTTGIKGIGKGDKAYQSIVALANATVGAGDMRMPDLIAALSSGVLASGARFGLKFSDIGAAIALEGDNIMNGSVSGHALTHMFSLLGAPSGVGQKAFASVGLGATQLGMDMRTKGLLPALKDLQAHLDAPLTKYLHGDALTSAQSQLLKYGLTPSQVAQMTSVGANPKTAMGQSEQAMILTRMFGGAKQSIPILTLLQEAGKYGAKQRSVAGAVGNYQDAIASTTSTTEFKAHAALAQLQVLGIQLGTKLLPAVNRGLTDFSHLLDFSAAHGHELAIAGAAVFSVWAGWKIASLSSKAVQFAGDLVRWKGATADVVTTTEGAAVRTSAAMTRMKAGVGGAVTGIVGVIGGYEAGAHHSAQGTLLAALSAAAMGFTIAGPWGGVAGGFAAISGALIGDLLNQKTAADKARDAMDQLAGSIQNAYSSSNFKMTDQVKRSVFGFVYDPGTGKTGAANKAKIAQLNAAGLTADALMKDFQDPRGWQNALTPAQRAKLGTAGMSMVAALFGAFAVAVSDAVGQAKALGLVPDLHVESLLGGTGVTAGPQTGNARILKPGQHLGTTSPGLPSLLGGALTRGSGSSSSSGGTGLSGLYPYAHHAIGGRVKAGVPTYVNEHGMETFIPDSDGTILPHGSGGGGGDHYHFHDCVITSKQQAIDLLRGATMQARARR